MTLWVGIFNLEDGGIVIRDPDFQLSEDEVALWSLRSEAILQYPKSLIQRYLVELEDSQARKKAVSCFETWKTLHGRYQLIASRARQNSESWYLGLSLNIGDCEHMDPHFFGLGWGEVLCLGKYHPYWSDRWAREKNPLHDSRSTLLLNLKRCKANAIDAFYKELRGVLRPESILAIVPPHDPENQISGMKQIVDRLSKDGWQGMPALLTRTKKIEQLSKGGDRSMDVHLKSIRVSQPQMIEDQQLILLDDIVTSGNSIHACKKLLLDAGAFLVQSIALGATTWELHA